MITKALLASAVAVGLFVAQPQTASAGVDVNVGIGTPSYYPVHSSEYNPPYYDDEDEDEDDYERITCWEGRRIVRNAGYRGARPVKCDGDVFRYVGWKRGQQWRVSVDSESGRIIRARRIYR